MIVGIGTDIIAVPRIEASLAKFGERIVDKILSVHEKSQFHQAANPVQFLASRFAAKEAFAVNLALNTKATASNVRGNVSRFAAAMATDNNKNTYWATDDDVSNASLTIDFAKPTKFNRFLVQEYIRLGQRVKAFTVEALVDGNWKEIAKATTIGYKRILRFPTVKATKVRFTINDSKACPVIANIGIYNAPQILASPSIIRNQLGNINIIPADAESVVYYTTDGKVPTTTSKDRKSVV